jgi:hypothetical protein
VEDVIPWKSVMRAIAKVDAADADGGLASENRVATLIAESPGGGLSESEVVALIAAATVPVYMQQTEPNVPGPWVWYRTDAYGRVIDILQEQTP